ncbi:ATPase AAA [Bacteroidia bacterium]|nr:ATPase AAA [Bacteroidia bacterium]
MKKLPIGTQSFKKLRQQDCLYVDKTEDIFNLITSGSVYFLSRPRRFGKSLLISTMDALFRCEKSLFEGLYIYDKWDWTQKSPVIRLDFAKQSFDNSEMLRSSLFSFMRDMAEEHGVVLESPELSDRFAELIAKVHKRTGQQVVVLIDEYDKPIIDHLTDLPIADANRKVLKGFFGVLKASDEHLRFVFLTGVSKFSKVSIFSELNNLADISMDSRYASICGYTQDELETCFDEYIARLAETCQLTKSDVLGGIRHWYNGYSWDGKTSVYNPFSTLLLFDTQTFSNYWFESGSPTFLINMVRERNDIKPLMGEIAVDETSFVGFDINQIGLTQILFQTGYLTVKTKQFIPMKPPKYTLAIPNEEVNDSFLAFLVSSYTGYSADQMPIIREQMQEQISNCDSDGFAQSLRILLANIPYKLHIKHESYYHSLLLAWMRMLGFDIQGEIMTNIGRIDAVWHQPGLTVVAEVKYSAKKKAASMLNEAMKQINDRKYYEKYLDANKVLLLAVAFSEKEVSCRMKNV